MSDLIDRQAAIDALWSLDAELRPSAIDAILNMLYGLPSVQPERKKGKWIDMGDFEQCSACKGTLLKEINTVYGKAIWIKSAYCPNCGADMRGEEHEAD